MSPNAFRRKYPHLANLGRNTIISMLSEFPQMRGGA